MDTSPNDSSTSPWRTQVTCTEGRPTVANEAHLQKVQAGPESWNGWRADNPKVRPDLTKADLAGAHLPGVHFGGANLRGVFPGNEKEREAE